MKRYRPSAGIILLNDEGKIFSGKRFSVGKSTHTFLWQMPQGGIQDGETPQEAAMRELSEETGIQSALILDEFPEWVTYDFPPHIKSEVFSGAFDGQSQKWFLMKFTGEEKEIDLQTSLPQEPPEFQEWAWMSPEELLAKTIIFRRPAYQRLFHYFFDPLGKKSQP